MVRKWISIFVLVCTGVFLCTSVSYSHWLGPVDVINGTWGSDSDQFGLEQGDTFDTVPGCLCVSGSGKLYVLDGVNNRIKAYSSTGALDTLIRPINVIEPEHWPGAAMTCDSLGNIYALPYEKKVQKYSASGQLLWEKENLNVGKLFVLPDNSIILSGNRIGQTNEAFIRYSTSGQLLATYSDRPLELGKVEEKYLGPSRYKVVVKYPDKTWEITGKGAFPNYLRDGNGNLYGASDTQIVRYDDQGNELERLTMPESIQQEESRGPGVEPLIRVIEEYGAPVLSPNGDVYTWKRTPDKYYIIKWVWQ